MNGPTLVNALRRHREALAVRWCRQFAENRAMSTSQVVVLREDFVRALIDEVIGLVISEGRSTIPRRHPGHAFARLAPFPDNVAICIDCFQAGTQVLGAFVVENSGPFALWSTQSRNCYLGELDATFHILVHREIEAVCELRLDGAFPPTVAPKSVQARKGLRELPSHVVSGN